MRWLKWPLRAAVGLVLFLAVLVVAGAGWLLGTESGLRWALGFAPPELALEEPRGTLAGTVSFRRVAWQGNEARNLSFDLNLLALLSQTISLEFLRAESVALKRPEGRTDSGGLPFRVRVADAQVRSLVFEGYEIHDLSGEYNGTASGHELQAAFSAAGARARLKAEVHGDITADAELQGLNLAIIDPELPQTALNAKLTVRGSTSTLRGSASIVNPSPGAYDRERLPFRTLDAEFSTDLEVLHLSSLKAALHPSGSIQGKGRASLEGGAFDVRVDSLDLRGVWSTLRRTRLSGPLALELSRGEQQVKGTLAQDDMSLSADARRKGDEIEVRALRARAGDSEATGSGRLQLGEPLRFAADLKLARFDPARWGDYPEGNLNGSLKASGDLAGKGTAAWDVAGSTLMGKPFASRGSARLFKDRFADADAWATWGENRATAKGSFGGPRDSVAWTLQVPQLGALAQGYGGEVRASGTARGTWKEPDVTLEAQAKQLRLTDKLVFAQAGLKASGTLERHAGEVSGAGSELDFAAKLQGGWRAGAWRGEILALKNSGAYPLELKTPAQLEAAARRVALGRFEADIAGGHAIVESVRWQDGRLTSSGNLRGLPAQWLLTALKIDRVKGDLALDGDWALASTPKLNGRLSVRRSRGELSLGDTPLGLSRAEVVARFTDDAAELAGDIAAGPAKAHVQGKVGGLTPQSALELTAELEAIELRTLTEPLSTQARLSGRLAGTLKIGGTLGVPLLSGAVRGDDIDLDVVPWGIALRNGRLRAELERNELRVTEARIEGGDGVFRATGTLPLSLTQAAAPDGAALLEWQARDFRLMRRPDQRLVVSGRGVTTFDGKRLGLIGQLKVDSANFELADDSLPTLASDVEVVGSKDDPIKVATRRQGPLPLDLDMSVDLGEQLTVRAYGFDGGLTGRVRLSTNRAGELLAHGKVQAVRARFHAYGQELAVDPGSLVFDGPVDSPGIDITAWRRHQAVEAGLRVTGTVKAPHVELVSNPPVSESEKLSWLVLGRAPTEASGADLALLQAASGALLGRGDSVPFQRRFAQRLGFDELTVRGSSELASNVVALGKRYSDKLYFSFEQAIGATTEYLVKLDYALTQRVSLRGQTGTTSGVGVFYRYSWD